MAFAEQIKSKGKSFYFSTGRRFLKNRTHRLRRRAERRDPENIPPRVIKGYNW